MLLQSNAISHLQIGPFYSVPYIFNLVITFNLQLASISKPVSFFPSLSDLILFCLRTITKLAAEFCTKCSDAENVEECDTNKMAIEAEKILNV